jgi:glucose-6-phosphate-specific signal transduction histidine kinase
MGWMSYTAIKQSSSSFAQALPGSDSTLPFLSAFLGTSTLASLSALTLTSPTAFTLATTITGSVAFRPFTVSVWHTITSFPLLFDVHDIPVPY